MNRLIELLKPKPHTAPYEEHALPAFPYLVIGLGNPGRKYQGNRHNIGFMLVDRLAARLGVVFSRVEFKALVTKGEYQDKKIILAKPQTFMNLSGNSAASLVHYYKIPLSQIILIYDDVDLPLGALRIRPGGGSGGHKGMASTIEQLGTQDFPRMRIGIDRPPGRMPVPDYVLQDFSKGDKAIVESSLERGVEAVLLFVSQGLDPAMNHYNSAVVTNGS